MKTIPTSWKPGGTTDRNLWYNNRGTMLLFIRIQKVNGDYVRIGSATIGFTEEGGIARQYNSDYFKGIGDIDFGLNFLEGWPGAVGQMGQCELNVNNGAIDGIRFSEMYDLDSFINATVDVFCVPQEVALIKPGLSIANSLQIYKGIITNYSQTADAITLSINEFSNTKHKKIPTRIDEFNETNTMGWNIPDSSKGSVVPVCFGSVPFFKAVCCSVSGTAPRIFKLCFHYPDQRTSTNPTLLYYYVAEKKHFAHVPTNQWTQTGYLSNSLYLISFNILDLAVYEEIGHYINPVEVVDAYPLFQRFLYPERFYDKKKVDVDDASLSYYYLFDYNVLISAARVKFEKSQFNSKSNFDLYLCSEFAYPNAIDTNPARWEVKHSINIGGTIYNITYDDTFEPSGDWDWDTTNLRRYISTIPVDYLPEGYAPSQTPRLIAQNLTPEQLTDTMYMFVSYKRTSATGAPNMYAFECCLKQVMIDLPREFYVRANFGNNILSTALEYLFSNFIDIYPELVIFENFEVDYQIDGQIHEEFESYDLFSAIANQFAVIFYEDDQGRERFIDISPVDPMYTITDDDVLLSNGAPVIQITRTEKDVYSSFYVDFQKNLATEEYEASKYVTPDFANVVHIDANFYKQLCHTAQVTYNTDKRLTIKLDYVRDGVTAERILAKLVHMYSSKKYVIHLQTSWKLMDLELGDQVALSLSVFSSSKNFYVAGINKNFDAKTIDLILFESPWDVSDAEGGILQKQLLSSTIGITENIVHRLEG